MSTHLNINHKLCTLCEICEKVCPFNAINIKEEKVIINAKCTLCKICIDQCPESAISLEVKNNCGINMDWTGVAVIIEFENGSITPGSLELIGKAIKLSKQTKEKVYAVILGYQTENIENELKQYKINKIFVAKNEKIKNFKEDIYASVLEYCLKSYIQPSIVLAVSSPKSRAFIPRVAGQLKTGITADCTSLKIEKTNNLIQIRPAFGGNAMAEIETLNSRPQFATVRPGRMEKAKKISDYTASIQQMDLPENILLSKINIIKKEQINFNDNLEKAEIILALGRGIQKKEDINRFEKFASILGAQLASSRALVEKGWMPPNRQIGLTGKNVSPKLLITMGISGSVQFVAGIENSKMILAVNSDPDANIFTLSDYSICYDMYEIMDYAEEKFKEE